MDPTFLEHFTHRFNVSKVHKDDSILFFLVLSGGG